MEESQEIKELTIDELRANMDEIFSNANELKYEIRFSPNSDDEVIKMSKDFASELDEFMHVVISSSEIDGCYSDYKDWFNIYYDNNISYRSSMMFREEMFSGLKSKRDKAMRYFNYLVENMVMINHMIMSIEFNKLYDECSIVKELEE